MGRQHFSGHRRFVAGAQGSMDAYIAAAKAYGAQSRSDGWFYAKPFDQAAGHPEFFYNMHNVVGILQAMSLPVHARVLEVGCGPGWLTEILALLGYRVTALDPSEEFIRIARARLDGAAAHHESRSLAENVRFFAGTIEQLDFPDADFDGIVFYDVLHHVIDEERCIANCARWLRPRGVLGVVEGAWVPGDAELEQSLREEMTRYGTLESPFTREYMADLLNRHGFLVTRLVGRAGFAEARLGDLAFNALVSQPAESRNDLVAVKSAGAVFSSDPNGATRVALEPGAMEMKDGIVAVELGVRNTGETVLLAGRPGSVGAIYLALRRGDVASPAMIEAANRVALPRGLEPGEQLKLRASFRLPENAAGTWRLDVVCEHVAWLSSRGSPAVEVVI